MLLWTVVDCGGDLSGLGVVRVRLTLLHCTLQGTDTGWLHVRGRLSELDKEKALYWTDQNAYMMNEYSTGLFYTLQKKAG